MRTGSSLPEHILSNPRVRALVSLTLAVCSLLACAPAVRPVTQAPSHERAPISTARSEFAPEPQAESHDAAWPDGPQLPGSSSMPPDLPDDAAEPAPSCACQEPRHLTPGDQLGDDKVALVVRNFEREWSSTLKWRAQRWFRIDPHATKISIKLSGLEAYETLCSPRLEPIACGGGRYLRGNLTARTSDGLLHFSSTVRIDYGPPGAIIVDLDRTAGLAERGVGDRANRVVLSVFPGATAAGNLSALGTATREAEATWDEIASWE